MYSYGNSLLIILTLIYYIYNDKLYDIVEIILYQINYISTYNIFAIS